MESKAIPDVQIDASSEWNANHAAHQGRLHFKATAVKAGCWAPKSDDRMSPWLQINLGNYYTTVKGVATQGRDQRIEWVTMYHLQHGDNVESLKYYVERGQNSIKVRQSS